MVFSKRRKSGHFAGFPGIDFLETGADSGPEGLGSDIIIMVQVSEQWESGACLIKSLHFQVPVLDGNCQQNVNMDICIRQLFCYL